MTRLPGEVRLAGGVFLVALIALSGCVGSAEEPTAENVSTFSSESEFRSYLDKAPSAPSPSVGVGGSAQFQGGDL
ncbi:MAG: hypothetical protein SV760_03605, partial [Halobacteria archaeon]|nr:hypothetical protein [Halobacteria archaeon]